jgi:type IV/VI secretion system ImpK/VasF family protein
MSDENGFGPNRTVYRPSPLSGVKAERGEERREPAAPSQVVDDVPQPAAALAHRNPLMAAAAPILTLVAGIRAGRLDVELPDLHRRASAAISEFDREVYGRYSSAIADRARYAVCATVDDVAMNLQGHQADAAEWARRTMVVRFFQENIGGDRFWVQADEMIARPDANRDLLELYHACMAAGFEGRYRIEAGGRQAHQARMQQAYAALEHVRGLSNLELSPRWRGEQAPARTHGVWGIVALLGGTAAAILLVVYLALRFMLAQSAIPALAALERIDPRVPMERWRSAPPLAPPEGAQLRTISACLKSQIDSGQVKVEQGATTVWIRTTNGELFKSASDQLEPGMRGLFDDIARCIDEQPGPVRIDGYTDADRIRGNLQFPDNQALSEARADTAARLVRERLSDGSRVSAQGFGDSAPIADNATAAGKQLNRRVEIVLERRS